jgi:hypothetical protein
MSACFRLRLQATMIPRLSAGAQQSS